MAERLLRARIAHNAGVHVASAGLLPDGMPASAGAVRALALVGIAAEDHVSRTVDAAMIRAADLVVCMAREHLREAVALVPERFGRTFTLKELVRNAVRVGPRPPAESLDGWLTRASAGRRPIDLMGSAPSDDVEDPIGRPDARYRACAAELDGLLDRLVGYAALDRPTNSA